MHNILSRLMGISALLPIVEILKTHGEINEKPLKKQDFMHYDSQTGILEKLLLSNT